MSFAPAFGLSDRFRALCSVLICILLCLPALQGPLSATTQAAEPGDEDLARLITRLQELRAELTQQQSRQGAYSESLLTTLNSLSEALLSAGAWQEALEAVEQQIQIIRINDGLYADAQISLIMQQLDIMASQSDWESMFERLNHLDWLFQRTTDTPAEERLLVLKQARDWIRLLLLRGPRTQEAQYLLRLRDLEQSAVDIARESDLGPQVLTATLYDLAQAELYIALGIVSTSDTSQQLIDQQRGISSPLRPNQTIRSVSDLEAVYGARTSTMIERSHRSAMASHYQLITELGEIQEIDAESAPEQAAMLKIYLGDSMLMRQQYELSLGSSIARPRGSGNIGNAGRYYNEAWQLFLSAGYTDEQLNILFACPTLLPLDDFSAQMGASTSACAKQDDGSLLLSDVVVTRYGIPGLRYDNLPDSSLISTPDGVSATLQFGVGMNGQPERIQILSSEPADTSARIRGRDALLDMQFRPALKDGKVIRLSDVHMTIFVLEPD
tara:strand:+ start:107618 stop:109114 length:1497 start_codon:yes stop_codon:yes gene_type:complete